MSGAPHDGLCQACGDVALVLLNGRALCINDYIRNLNQLIELGLTPAMLAEDEQTDLPKKKRRYACVVLPPLAAALHNESSIRPICHEVELAAVAAV